MAAARPSKASPLEAESFRHSALSPLIPYHFERLRIGITLVNARGWHVVYNPGATGHLEREHGIEDERARYNARCMKEVMASGAPVLGEHRGFSDLFVPVIKAGQVREMLVSGPFRRSPCTSTEVLECWRDMTGAHGHVGDPTFSGYLSMWLKMRELNASAFKTYRSLVLAFAKLVAGEGDAQALSNELDALYPQITEIASVDQMWAATRQMTDSTTALIWSSKYATAQRAELRLRSVPEHALVGLTVGRADATDPVDEVIRRSQFQKACAQLARARGNVVSGPIGDHGVVFLMGAEASKSRSQLRLNELAERATQLARRQFQLKLHLGFGPFGAKESVPGRYLLALAAAEKALALGVRSTEAPRTASRPEYTLRDARAVLAVHPSTPTGNLAARFERYLDVVAVHSGYRMEPIAAHLEMGLERLVEALLKSGALDSPTYDAIYGEVERASKKATTLLELFSAFRRAVADLERALRQPVLLHQDRSLRRALAYIREHASESVTLVQVARLAGFAPAYFSRLFKQREGVTFERYLADLRIARAKQALTDTTLSTARVAQLCGFSSSQYFHRAFKGSAGETPLEYRRRVSKT